MQKLTADIPSIALGTFDCKPWHRASSYLERGMPVLLMDSRPPAGGKYATGQGGFADMQKDMLDLERQLVSTGCIDKYSPVPQLHAVLKNVLEADEQRYQATLQDDVRQGIKWIYNVVEDWERTERAQRDGQGDSSTEATAEIPSKVDRANEGLQVVESMETLRIKVQARWRLMLLQKWEDSLLQVDEEDRQRGLDGINAWLLALTIYCVRRHPDANEGKPDAIFKAHDARTVSGGFLVQKRGMHKEHVYCLVPQVAGVSNASTDAAGKEGLPEPEPEPEPEQPSTGSDSIKQMKDKLLGTVRSMKHEYEQVIEDDGTTTQLQNLSAHLKRRDVMLSKSLYTGSLLYAKQLEQIMQRVVRIDRLPECNSIEATRILCQAWDSVDLFVLESKRSKRIAKLSYVLLLFLGAAASVVTTLSINRPDIISDSLRGSLVVGLSLAGAAIASATSYLNPAQRWTELRGAALTLESECWKFRTRSGIYKLAQTATPNGGGGGGDSSAETLRQVLESVRQHVAKSASVSETAFGGTLELFSKPPQTQLSAYTHGQYRGCGTGGAFGHATQVAAEMAPMAAPSDVAVAAAGGGAGSAQPGSDGIFDDHHSPTAPEVYLRLRVEPMVRFYQARLPSYYRWRSAYEVIAVLGSLGATLLAFLHVDEWVAVLTAVTAMITAWHAFSGTDRKLSRYSNTIDKVQSIMLWWRSLSSTDKALPARIHQLVLACEETFERERESWASTSMTTQLLTQAAADGDEGEGEEEEGSGSQKKKRKKRKS